MKEIIIIGVTGSIGTQTLDIVRKYPDRFKVVGMSCNSRINEFNNYIREFLPKYIHVADSDARSKCVRCGAIMLQSLEELVSINEGQIVVTAIVGIAGLSPTISAINSGKDIALANKETLVAGGELVMQLARDKNVNIYPVDSEHSAIWQSMEYGRASDVKGIILTASGGAFRGKSRAQLENVTLSDALCHPTWSMGQKVTIDSATLMNKGLEVIEAMHLFNIDVDNIDVVIHKESIIHSLVTYNDNSVIAELSNPDMVLPIQLALTYPEKLPSRVAPLNLVSIASLSFENPDLDTFRCLAIARECGRLGGLYPAVMNGANEVAVKYFIDGRIKFLEIASLIQSTLDVFNGDKITCIDDVLSADIHARKIITSLIK